MKAEGVEEGIFSEWFDRYNEALEVAGRDWPEMREQLVADLLSIKGELECTE